MMTPTILVYTNCQGQAVTTFLQQHPPLSGYNFVHLRAWLNDQPTQEQLSACRIFIYQKSFGMPSFFDRLPPDAIIICIPLLSCSYLFPYNFDRPDEPVGWRFPYGDRFLISQIARGESADRAAQTYLDLDLGEKLNLDRLYQLETAKWRQSDSQSDVAMADFLIEHAPDRRLFLTPDHPTDKVMIRLVNGILGRIGLPEMAEPDWEHAAHLLGGVEVPVHPSIIAHFRLSYLAADYHYPLWGGGLRLPAFDCFRRYARALKAPSIDQALSEAEQDILDGDLASAGNICFLAHLRQPGHPRTLALLAVLTAVSGQRERAVTFLRQAFPAPIQPAGTA